MPNPPPPDTTNLFDRATAFDGLWAGWERVRANNGAAGGDGVTVALFGAAAQARISRLSHALRNGRYTQGPERRAYIAKSSGGLRPLDIPCIADRVAQASVSLVLTPVLDPMFEDASFAYRPGRSVAQAVQRVMRHRRDGFDWVVDGDIVKYFERVSHERLLSRLDKAVDDIKLVDLIGLWLENHAPGGLGLPQGSPLSPLLANLFLDSIDEAIEGHGVRLVRFADDFLLLTRAEADAHKALARMRGLLVEHGLEMHPDKTRIVPFSQGFRFLGHVFVRSMVWKEVIGDDAPPEDAIAAAEAMLAAANGIDAPATDTAEAQKPPPGRWSARRRTLYCVEPARRLTAKGEQFQVIENSGAEVLRLPHARVDRIEVGPEVGIDVAALDLAAHSDTEIIRIDGNGMTLGRFAGPDDSRAGRQLKQAAAVLDPARRIAMAHALALGRVFNQRILLKRLNRTRRIAAIIKTVTPMGRIVRRLRAGTEPNVNTVMGYEGQATALYWPALAVLLDKSWAFSGRRQRRIGLDPFNIVLDVLSSLVTRDVVSAIRRTGLHPGFSFLHTSEDGEESLAFDLVEEFRAPIAEACAFGLFARLAITETSFVTGPATGMRLGRDGWYAVIRGYEAWMSRAILNRATGQRGLWRGLIDDQAEAFAAALETGASYHPYEMDY